MFPQLQSLTLQIHCGFAQAVPVNPQLVPTLCRTIRVWLTLVCWVAFDGEEKRTVFTERKETLLFSLLNHGVPLGNKPHRSCILFIKLQSSDQVTMKTPREQEVATFSVPGPITVVGVRKGHCKDANH